MKTTRLTEAEIVHTIKSRSLSEHISKYSRGWILFFDPDTCVSYHWRTVVTGTKSVIEGEEEREGTNEAP